MAIRPAGLALAILLGGGIVGSTVVEPARADGGRAYSKVATVRCLSAKGGRVGPVTRQDSRRLAFAQLAQKNSILVRIARGWVAVAFEESRIDALALREALLLPNDPYRVETVATAVLMSPRRALPARRAVLACLR